MLNLQHLAVSGNLRMAVATLVTVKVKSSMNAFCLSISRKRCGSGLAVISTIGAVAYRESKLHWPQHQHGLIIGLRIASTSGWASCWTDSTTTKSLMEAVVTLIMMDASSQRLDDTIIRIASTSASTSECFCWLQPPASTPSCWWNCCAALSNPGCYQHFRAFLVQSDTGWYILFSPVEMVV